MFASWKDFSKVACKDSAKCIARKTAFQRHREGQVLDCIEMSNKRDAHVGKALDISKHPTVPETTILGKEKAFPQEETLVAL